MKASYIGRIGDICEIRTGHTFRKKPTHQPDGNVTLIQPKDISSDGSLSQDDLLRADVSFSKPLRKSDVLFSNRGRFTAAVFDLEGDETYIATSSCLILSVRDDRVLPEYLALYLNSWNGQMLIRRFLEQTTVAFINRSTLKEITVPIPPLEKQRTLVKVEADQRKYSRLSLRKLELHKQILNHALPVEGTRQGDNR